MISNYFLVAIRNLRKHKLFSAINIAGLAIGISASLVIYLLVYYDFNFDKFHPDGERIYRVVSDLQFPGQSFTNGGVCSPLGEAMRNEVPGLEITASFQNYSGHFKVGVPENATTGKQYFKNQKELVFTDENYFKLFTYKWLAGDVRTALAEPFKVVLTESRAKLYFPGVTPANAIGKTITYDDTLTVSVSGVVKDYSEATDIRFKEFISFSTAVNTGLKRDMQLDQWTSVNGNSQLFVKLAKGTNPKDIEKKLVSLRNKYSKNEYMKTTNKLQPLSELHFTGKYDMFSERQANKTTLYGLLAVAGFLLLLGCINFINLTTAQATTRAKEIGIRKTMGSSILNLVFQFLGETFILTTLATLLSLVIVPLLLKMFADFIPSELSFDLLNQPHIILFIIGLIAVVSVLSGFYPALVLARFKPVLVLKNQVSGNSAKGRKAWIRKSLTVSQFVIAQFFIIATLLVAKQISFVLNKDMGFNKEAILNIHVPWNVPGGDQRQVLLNKFRSIPGIDKVSLSGETPASHGYSTTSMKYSNGDKNIESMVEIKQADSIYFAIYKLALVAGHYPANGDTADKEFVVNEAYARFLGFKNPADAVGAMVERGPGKVPITGVLKDFHLKSMHSPIVPLVYTNRSSNHRTFHVLLKANSGNGSWTASIQQMEKTWKESYPEVDFKYEFFDESIASFYTSERNMSKLLKWATGLAIFISCLGMLGLVIYTTNQRVKEIGVRKVLGASVPQIVSLLSREFVALVLAAFVIATPLAWWAIANWMGNFEYRTEMSWWIFAVSGLLMLIGALLTLSFQTIRSATATPVKSLRTE